VDQITHKASGPRIDRSFLCGLHLAIRGIKRDERGSRRVYVPKSRDQHYDDQYSCVAHSLVGNIHDEDPFNVS
jgi:hypothetical protein